MLRRSVLILAGLSSLLAPSAAQNSTRKVRPEPSESAAKAGTLVAWRASLEDALAESKESGRPVLWYVPTVTGSPMDRQAEIDRYMMAGPFSWPRVIAVLDEFFVPVRAVPGRDEQQRYDLRPGRFVEPGYLVLNGDGEERARLDQITTLHREWFLRRLIEALPENEAARAARFVPDPDPDGQSTRDAPPVPRQADELLELLSSQRPWSRTLPPLGDEDLRDGPALSRPEQRFVDAVRHKIRAESEGHGPFRYGFEIPFVLSDEVLRAPAVRGTRAPAGVYGPVELRALGTRFLAWMQGDDGGFTDSRYDFGGADSLPNVWTAVTALAGRAMLDVAARAGSESLREQASRVALRAFDYVSDDANLELADRDELVWARIYRARFAADWLRHRDDRADDALRMLTDSLHGLREMQQSNGAWFHEYPNPFVTASALIALAEGAHAATEGPSPDTLGRGLAALKRCRTDDGAISYGDSGRGRARAAVAGSVGRMPVVEHALARFGAGESGALERAIAMAFEFHDEMDRVRKYDDHASRLGYGGFFFWYGMHGRAEAIAALPDDDARSGFAARLRQQVLDLPEIDGCFVDSHELGRVYGTAMALICLGLTEP